MADPTLRHRAGALLVDGLGIGAVIVLLLLLVEGGARLLEPPLPAVDPRASSDIYDDPERAAAYFAEHRVASAMRWEPYVYWRRPPFQGAFITVDSLGRRRTVQPEGLDAGAPLVYVFGGSTVWGSGVGDAHTIPSALSRDLAHLGRPARVVNWGESGYVSGQGAALLGRLLIDGHRPDVVVFYDGVNDVYSAFQNGRAGLPMNEANRASEFAYFRSGPSEGTLARQLVSRLLRRSALWRGIQRASRGEPVSPFRDLDDGERQALRNAVAQTYAGTADLVTAWAEAYGFEAVFAWQPTLFSKQRLSPSEQRALAEDEAVRVGLDDAYEAFQAIPTLAPLRETALIDLSAVLDAVPAPLYFDYCHLGQEGNRLVAAALADSLVARGVLERAAAP